MTYVDGFLLPVPTKNLAAYRRLATQCSKIWRAHGALEYRECVGDDLGCPNMVPFPKTVGAKKGETVVFAWVVFKSRAHRDRANAAIMKDPRMVKIMQAMPKKPPFDCRRMRYGGFKVLVEA